MKPIKDYVKIPPEVYDKIMWYGGEEHKDDNGQTYLTHPDMPAKYITEKPEEYR